MTLKHQTEINLVKSGKHPNCASEMTTINISLNGVETLLKNLNPDKASGPDEISPRLLKNAGYKMVFIN